MKYGTFNLQMIGTPVDDTYKLTRLWAHEALRVFHDRLVSDEDRAWFGNFLKVRCCAPMPLWAAYIICVGCGLWVVPPADADVCCQLHQQFNTRAHTHTHTHTHKHTHTPAGDGEQAPWLEV